MKKRILIFSVLFYVVTYVFGLEKLNVGSYQIGNISIECYDDQSIRINDLKNVDIIIGCLDVDTAVKASAKIREIIESKNIASIEQMLEFFDKEKLEYKYEKYGNGSNYYVDAQMFLEEYLVPKYGIKSGKKTISSSGDKTEYKNWNNESKQYDYAVHTSSDKYSDDYTVEYKNWNKNIQVYEYKIYRYSNYMTEYKNWNKEKQCYDYSLDSYSDHTVEYENFNKEKDRYDYCLATYSDYTEEYKDWNKEKGAYDYCLDTYSDRTVSWKYIDDGYFNVDIKDNTGKIIAYGHIIKPVKNGDGIIEVFSGGVVYQQDFLSQ